MRREVELQSPPRRPPRPEAELRAVELGYVLWTPQSVELRTERHHAAVSTFGYRLYTSVVFHGLHGTDGALGIMSGAVSFVGIGAARFLVDRTVLSLAHVVFALFKQTDLAGLDLEFETVNKVAAVLVLMQVVC